MEPRAPRPGHVYPARATRQVTAVTGVPGRWQVLCPVRNARDSLTDLSRFA
jgi:hypothetical protein